MKGKSNPIAQKYSSKKFFWKKPVLKASIEGGEGSVAEKTVHFIEDSKDTYPYRYKYRLIGPNSNTYVQWVLNEFPEFDAKLPKNAFGKKYYGLNRHHR